MTKITCSILIILFIFPSFSFATDFGVTNKFGVDKVLHYAFGGMFMGILSHHMSKRNAFYTTTGIGLLKEVIDVGAGGKWDWGDVGFTMLGAGTSWVFIIRVKTH